MTDQKSPTSGPQSPRRRSVRRTLGGCLLAFACVVLIYLAIGGVAVYQGLQERVVLTQQEAVVHYQRGLDHMKAGKYDLAIAELEHTLRLDPSHREARVALREAKTIALAQPTPTSATLNEAQNAILNEAEALVQAQRWPEAVQRLVQLRDLSPDFQAQRVAELLYTANFNHGLLQVQAGQMDEATHSFEQALAERPDDAEAGRQLDMASLYASAQATWGANWPDSINFLEQLYTLAPDYLDVKDRLYQAYKMHGDALAAEEAWCLAERQYGEAARLQPGPPIQSQWDEAARLCRAPTVTPGVEITPTALITRSATATATTAITGSGGITSPTLYSSGSILFSRFNEKDAQWEIASVTPGKGSPASILGNATQPAASPNGQLLLYHAEVKDSEGLHVLNLATRKDTRVTTFREDVTPDWAPDNLRIVFPSQRSGNRRWQIYIAWADAKGEAVILVEGRSPAWSPDGTTIAYQGADAQGNNPGLYLVSAQGGPSTRLTRGESDRAPAWSPACTTVTPAATTATITATTTVTPSEKLAGGQCHLAFMSSQSGNWEVYVADVASGAAQRLTTSPGNDGLPTWSPNGGQIAFVSDRGGSWGIYVMPATGGAAVKVADWGKEHADWLVERITWVR